MQPFFLTAYKDGLANGVGLIFAIGFTMYFTRREDFGGVAIGFGMLALCGLSIWLVHGKYKEYDQRVAKLAKEDEE